MRREPNQPRITGLHLLTKYTESDPPLNDSNFRRQVCVNTMSYRSYDSWGNTQRYNITQSSWQKIKPKLRLLRFDSALSLAEIEKEWREDEFFIGEFQTYFYDLLKNGQSAAMANLNAKYQNRDSSGEGEAMSGLENRIFAAARKINSVLKQNKIKLN